MSPADQRAALETGPSSRTSKKRSLRWVALALLAALALAGYAGWRVWQVRADLQAAETSAHALEGALRKGDQRAAEQHLMDLQQQSGSASDSTSGLLWSALSHAPVLGDDAAAVGEVSQTLDDLADDGLAPLVDSAAALDAETFAPRRGAFPLDAVSALSQPITRGHHAFSAAGTRLQTVQVDGLIEPVRGPLDELKLTVAQGTDALASARKAVRLLPPMLGGRGPRHYLLLFLTEADVRAAGSAPGAMALLKADRGHISMSRTLVIDPVQLGTRGRPLSARERAAFDPQLAAFFQEAGFAPHFPRSAQLITSGLRRERGGRLDGVVSVDPVALSYVLAVTGPVDAGGVTVSAATAVPELAHRIYRRETDAQAREAFFAVLAESVLNVVTSGRGSSQGLVRALLRAAEEDRLVVHSFHGAEQRILAGTPIAPGPARGAE